MDKKQLNHEMYHAKENIDKYLDGSSENILDKLEKLPVHQTGSFFMVEIFPKI